MIKRIVPFLIFVLLVFGIGFIVLPLPGDVTVLMYHFIDSADRAAYEKNVVSLQSFKKQMQFLKDFGYRVISVSDYEKIRKGALRPKGKEVLITFDDANYTYYDKAYPVLKQFSYPSVLFVVSGNMAEKLHGSMTEEQILEILPDGLTTVGSHSVTHPVMTELSVSEIDRELLDSKNALEKRLGVQVDYLAYPTGEVNSTILERVPLAGYHLAFTTSAKKLGDIPEGPYAITRVKISRTSDHLFSFWFKVSGLYDKAKKITHFLKPRNRS